MLCSEKKLCRGNITEVKLCLCNVLMPSSEVFLVYILLIPAGYGECMCLSSRMAILLSPGLWHHWLHRIVRGSKGKTNGCACFWVSFSPVVDASITFCACFCVKSWWMFRVLEVTSAYLFSLAGTACEELINLVEQQEQIHGALWWLLSRDCVLSWDCH